MTTQRDRVPAEQAIRDARAAQNDAIARSDFGAAASFWTEDVTIRRALGDAVQGAQAARAVLEQAAGRRPALLYQRLTQTVHVSGPWPLAYEEGVWSARLAPGARPGAGPGSELESASAPAPAVLSGRFAAQWVLRGDRWLIRSELFVALEGAGPGRGFSALP